LKLERLTQLLSAESLSVGVEAEQNTLVDKRVLVLGPWTLLVLGIRRADNRLDLVAVDQASNVGVSDLGSGEAKKNSEP
jgi:hypothetical protein